MSNKAASWLIFVILCIIWGSSFILMQYSKEDLSSAQIASVRIFSAGLVFLPFAFKHIYKIPRNKLGLVIMTGVFGNLLPAFLFAEAIARNIDSSIAGILNSLTPVCVVLIATLIFRDKIKKQKILGVFLGFAGLVLLTLTRGEISLENIGYSLLIVIGTISYGVNVKLSKSLPEKAEPGACGNGSLAFMTIPTGLYYGSRVFESYFRLLTPACCIASVCWALRRPL